MDLWIPIMTRLTRKYEVVQIASLTGLSRHEVVGRLVEFWGWVTEETGDGRCHAVSVTDVARLVGSTEEFLRAMQTVGWLGVDGTTIEIPKFERWMGRAARIKLTNARRQQNYRDKRNGGGVTSVTARAPRMSRPNKNNKREENTPPTSPPKRGAECADFDQFWAAYPRHTAKKKARESWNHLRPDAATLAAILAALEKHKRSDQWRRNVIPHASTWLNQRRWEDDLFSAAQAGEPPGARAARLAAQKARAEADRANAAPPEEILARLRALRDRPPTAPESPEDPS